MFLTFLNHHQTKTNMTILITGGNAGIGKATAIGLAKQGAEVIIACRNETKAKAAVEDIKKESNSSKISYLNLDLSSFKSIRQCVADFKSKYSKLDVLINNAAVIVSDWQFTEEGFEAQFGVNHIGHFLLTHLLLDNLQTAEKPRVVNVSSKAHFGCKNFDFDSLTQANAANKSYSTMGYYSQAKLANVLFTRGLAKRYPKIISNSLHPGVVGTSFVNKSTNLFFNIGWSILKPFLMTPEKGAATSIYLATSPAVEGVTGGYFDNKKQYKPSPLGRDDALVEKLWKVSEEFTGL